jgi:E3 ubiquitin-protein ligase CHFR
MSDLGDLIQSSEVYGCFDHNTVEVDIMLDYLTAQELSPRHIYREVASHILSQPSGFRPLIELDLFVDIHSVTAGIDENPDAPRNRICRQCATEVMLWGIKDWWIRERQKGFLEETVTRRPDCKEGASCSRQKDLAHAREYNHIIAPRFSGDSVLSTNALMTGTQGSSPVFAAMMADADAARQLEPEIGESRDNAAVTDLPITSLPTDGL